MKYKIYMYMLILFVMSISRVYGEAHTSFVGTATYDETKVSISLDSIR